MATEQERAWWVGLMEAAAIEVEWGLQNLPRKDAEFHIAWMLHSRNDNDPLAKCLRTAWGY